MFSLSTAVLIGTSLSGAVLLVRSVLMIKKLTLEIGDLRRRRDQSESVLIRPSAEQTLAVQKHNLILLVAIVALPWIALSMNKSSSLHPGQSPDPYLLKGVIDEVNAIDLQLQNDRVTYEDAYEALRKAILRENP